MFFLLVLTFLSISSGFAQTVRIDETTQKKYVSVDVPKTYERIIAKGYESIELFDYLGNYYYKANQLQKSKTYFDMLFAKYDISKISQSSIEIYKKIIELDKSKRYITELD